MRKVDNLNEFELKTLLNFSIELHLLGFHPFKDFLFTFFTHEQNQNKKFQHCASPFVVRAREENERIERKLRELSFSL